MDTIRITSAEYLNDYSIKLRFSTGTESAVDFSELMRGPIFEPLKDIQYFASFKLNEWTIYWENGADFSPEFLHDIALKNQTILS